MIKFLKNYFIPNRNNDYHPHIFKREEVIKIIAGVLLLEAIFLFQVFLVVPRVQFFASVLPGVLVNLANSDRQSNDVNSLVTNPLLEQAAQLKANDMATRGYFSHVTPDGKTPWYWLNLVGYKYSAAGENLAINFVDSKDINNAWMNSPSHRANILNNKFTEIGIAAAMGVYQGRETIFVVQFFGKSTKASVVLSRPSTASTVTPAQSTNQPVTPVVSGAANPLASVKSETTEITVGPANVEDNNKAADSVSLSQPAEDIFAATGEMPTGENPNAGVISTDQQTSNAQPAEAQQRGFVDSFRAVATSPRVIINLIFIILGGIIFLALMLKLLSRTGIQYAHPVFSGLLILVILISLFYFNHYLLLARAQIF